MPSQRATIEAVYRVHGARLWRALVAYAGDQDIASEARAEAFAQALARDGGLRSPANWVWTAAFKIATGMLKERNREIPTSVERAVELPEPVDDLVQALASLPNKQRLAVILHDYADRPTDEVARVLGVTRATVHVHLSQGRKRLRTLIQESNDG